MTDDTVYVGLDVHKLTISVAIAEDGRDGIVRVIGTIKNCAAALNKLIKRLASDYGQLEFCYEAGPCGYVIYRALVSAGHGCTVVAPSMIPRRPGDRVKTDRRDATQLACLHRAGQLFAVWVPDEGHEAMRDLSRAREAAMNDLRRQRQRLHGFLLRHGRIYEGSTHWSAMHRRWLASLRFDEPMHHLVLEDNLRAIEQAEDRLAGLEKAIREAVPDWSLAPLVAAYEGLRGVALITAVKLASELGDLSRFDSPHRLMSYLGLVPSEDSSGPRRRLGSITGAGNARVRRVLVEGAWSYRLPARIAVAKKAKLNKLPQPVQQIAWKAQERLCPRYQRLQARGKIKTVVTTAIAREMAAFIWAIARQVPLKAPAR